MLSPLASQCQPGMSTVTDSPLWAIVMGRVPRYIRTPVFGQTELFIVILLDAQQTESVDGTGRELHLEWTRFRVDRGDSRCPARRGDRHGMNVMYFHNSPLSIDWMTPTVRSRPNSIKAAVLGAEPITLRRSRVLNVHLMAARSYVGRRLL